MRAVFAAVGILLTALAFVARPAAANPPCSPLVEVVGEPGLAHRVGAALRDAGVDAGPIDGCPRVRAEVEARGALIAVRVRADDGRLAERTVSDATIAAIWIESWARRDVQRPLLVARSPALVDEGPAPVVSSSHGASRRGLSAAVGLDRSSADDDTSWRWLSVSATTPVGGVCLGGVARLGDSAGASANQGLTFARRDTAEVLATASLPRRLGQAVLSPQLGVGLGAVRTVRDEALPEADPCVAEPNQPPGQCPTPPPPYVGDGFTALSISPRLQAGVSLTLPIAGALYLDVGAAAQLAPWAHRDAYVPPYASEDAPMTNPDGSVDPALVDPALLLPGEPWGQLRVGIALRWGPP